MSRSVLQQALRPGARHVSPFLVLGDPSPAISIQLVDAAVAAGATMLELGLPFSDPCADGPAIQQACGRALAAGTTTDAAFAALRAVARRHPAVPRNLLVYGNLVHARGVEQFCAAAAAAGASSLLVPDLPLGEDGALHAACARHDLGHVRMVGPATPADRIAASAAGAVMLYVAGVQGVTGVAPAAGAAREALLRRVRDAAPATPICLGFGLADAAACAHAFAHGAAVAVVGSHLERVIQANAPQPTDRLVTAFGAAVAALRPDPAVLMNPRYTDQGATPCS